MIKKKKKTWPEHERYKGIGTGKVRSESWRGGREVVWEAGGIEWGAEADGG